MPDPIKLSDIEDADLLATSIQLDRLENKLVERFNGVDAKILALDAKILTLDAKIEKVSRTIWLPALAAVIQILLLIFHKKLGF
jgi:hypothetical protein